MANGYKQSCKDRRKVEMLFAHLTRILKLDRLRLRGPSGARDESLLAAIAQNRRRMAKRLMFAAPKGCRLFVDANAWQGCRIAPAP
jgi:hypothetical protein